MDSLKVFSGNAHPALARAICDYLDIPLGEAEITQFSNENTFVRILENVRECDLFMVQPICHPVNDSLVELLIMMDAARRASAGRVTAVVPYYGYGRTDKKDQPRVPITARLVADLITTSGAGRLLTVDLHAGQIQGFFNIPVDELTALYLIRDYFRVKALKDLVVVATDIGISKRARDLAEHLDAPLAIVEKRRLGNRDRTETLNVIGDVEGKRCLTFDDEIDTAGTLVGGVDALLARGATEIYSCATHPILSGPAVGRLRKAPIKELVVTDTVPVPPEKQLANMKVLPMGPLLGEAILRIHEGRSIGEMFEPRTPKIRK
ncbi:MAG: ribose-phosphate pyrophosphokinase [Chloroflexi bacterium]|nr:ribose-phosphate pyrophosphokinase [Chloroflexota bacterium]